MMTEETRERLEEAKRKVLEDGRGKHLSRIQLRQLLRKHLEDLPIEKI